MTLKEGEIIAEHYLLTRQLGSGSFGDVWLARNLLADVDVAIKFYGTLDESGLQTFRNEFRVAYKLRHPNLLNIAHFDVFKNCPYLVMPYCENGSMRQYVGRMQESDVWKFISDVTSGLAFLHSQQPPIVHQDIKPDNILITSDGRYVISDFGISRSLRTELSRTNNVSTSSGTLAYMGPERFSERPLTVLASDIWAFGMTLYEVLTGDVLWEGMGGCVQLNGARIPRMDNVSPKLSKIIMACLSVEPYNRPSAQQIHQYAYAYLQHRQLPTLTDQYDAQEQGPEPKYDYSSDRRKDLRPDSKKRMLWKSIAGIFSSKKVLAAVASVAGIVLIAGGFLFAMNSLSEERDFCNCKSRDDFEQFIKKYPNSKHVMAARMRIAAMTPHDNVPAQQEETQQEEKVWSEETVQAPHEKKTEPVEEIRVIVEAPTTATEKKADGNPISAQTTEQTANNKQADDDATFRACSSVPAYEDYLMRFPDGKHKAEAERAIKNLSAQSDINTSMEMPQEHRRLQHKPPSSYSISIRQGGRTERPHRQRHDNRRTPRDWRR